MTKAKHPKGIRPWKGGWQAYVRVHGTLLSKSYPPDTPLDTMKTWRRTMQIAAPKQSVGPAWKRDVARYLRRVRAMPTYDQRRQHLRLWLDALGWNRARGTITAAELDHVLQGWLHAGIAPDTVRKRRTSLLSMFTTLDGKAAPNPVRETKPPKARAPIVRGLETATLQRVLDSLPPSTTAARLKVMAWTGLPPGLLMQIAADDVDLTRAEVRVVAREKGAGSPARVLPLTPQAVDAFRELAAVKGYGKFAIAAAGRVLHRGCKRVGIAPIRLYDLRHSFGAMLYRTTKDLPTVARFLLHKNLTSTARYAYAAVGDVDRAAAVTVGQLFGTTFSPKTQIFRDKSRPTRRRTGHARRPRKRAKSSRH